ncbi:hypothetical protein F5Y15DRAFT_106201 [Xylariaceae sp. FL0016]|nr:hypothetical protein F5Y15DRAFT_106201 [Xylariaceae sp. FL0016]
MSSIIPEAVNKVKNMVGGEKGSKIAQLDQVSQTVTKDDRITTDWGVKQGDTDGWLRISDEDRTGPMLLEDSAAREKVRFHSHEAPNPLLTVIQRFTDLTTSAFPSVWCMPAVLAPSGTLSSSKVPKM